MDNIQKWALLVLIKSYKSVLVHAENIGDDSITNVKNLKERISDEIATLVSDAIEDNIMVRSLSLTAAGNFEFEYYGDSAIDWCDGTLTFSFGLINGAVLSYGPDTYDYAKTLVKGKNWEDL
jgi:hypothetical protein